MQSFAIIENKPVKSRVVSVTHTDLISPHLKLDKIQQPKPQKFQQEIIHIIDKRKHIKEQPLIQLPQINAPIQEQSNSQFKSSKLSHNPEPIQEKSEQNTAQKTQRKPIFRKIDQHKQQNPEMLEKMSEVESVYLSQTSDYHSSDSERYYLTSGYRKMKGEKNPYAETTRIKDKTQRKKKLKSQPDPEINIIPAEEDMQKNHERAFRKKKIFEHERTEKKKNDQDLLDPYALTKKKNDKETDRGQELENIKKKERPAFIKLKPKGYVEKRQETQSLRESSSSQSLEVFSFDPMSPMIL